MFKKAVKNIYLLAIMFLFVGGIFLLPGGTNQKVKAEESVSTIENTTGDTLWTDQFANMATEYTVGSTSLYGQTVKTIGSASDLAYVAYMVNNGTSGWVDGIFKLTADIDLSGSLWTPIGVSGKPFKGTFYGEGYTISNISINDYSNISSGSSGLFGYINNAKILDVNLSGWYQNLATSGSYKGTLVADMTGTSYIINCYDNITSAITQTGADVKTIGGTDANGYIYRGGYQYNASSNSYKTYTSQSAINATVDVTSGSYTSGYVGVYTYNPENGALMIGDKQWYTPNRVKVLLNSSLSPTNTDVATIYRGRTPVLRVTAVTNNNGKDIYPFLAGSKATITAVSSASWSAGLVRNIGSSATTITVYLNHNYGTRGTSGNALSYTFGYDQSFASFFASNIYAKTRAGYTLEGVYANSGLTTKMDISTLFSITTPGSATFTYFNSCFPVANATYYFKWAAKTDRAFNVKFYVASDEGGNFTNANTSHTYGASNIISYTNKTAGTVTFDITLNAGHKMENIASKTTSTTSSDGIKATSTSGIYADFNVATNTYKNYSTNANCNNDSHAPVAVSAVVKSGSIASGITYTITVNNLCGTTGEVQLVIERQWLNLYMDINLDARRTIDYTLALTSNSVVASLTQTQDGTFNSAKTYYVDLWTLKVRRGEKPSLRLVISESSDDAYVLSRVPSNNLYVAEDISNSVYASYDNGITKYFTTLAFALKESSSEYLQLDNSTLGLYLGPLETKVAVELYGPDGNKLSNITGISATINGQAGFQNATQLTPINKESTFAVDSNGIYEADYVVVNENNKGSFGSSANSTSNQKYLSLTEPAVLVDPYINGMEGVNYTVKIYFKYRKFDLNYEFYFAGTKIDVSANKIGNLIESITSNYASQLPNTTLNGTYDLTDVGLGALKFASYEIVNYYYGADGSQVPVTTAGNGYTLSTISANQAPNVANSGVGTVSTLLGTYNTTIKVNLTYKQVTLIFNSLHLNTDTAGSLITGVDHITTRNEICTFNYTTGGGLVLSLNDGTFNAINIHSQYYLLGWYLQNGKVVDSSSYSSFFTNSTFVNAVAVGGSTTDNLSFEFSGISAQVGKRVVHVDYDAGATQAQVDGGYFYNSSKTKITTLASTVVSAGNVTYANTATTAGEYITLNSSVFFKLGHTFAVYVASGTNGAGTLLSNCGTLADGKYYINGENWFRLFDNNDNPMKDWTNFTTANTALSYKEVTLTATWEKIVYNINIDNGTNTANFSIDDRISYQINTSNPKDGQATYTIGSTDNIVGAVKHGYQVTSFKITQTGTTGSITTTGAGTQLDTKPSNFIQFVASDYWFAVNSSTPITIETLRNPASYLIYLDNSAEGYYSYAWDESKDANYGQISDGQITINVTFDAVPLSLTNALNNSVLSVTRTGYKIVAWAIAGDTYSKFDETKPYTYAFDQHIVPIWEKTSNTTSSTIDFTADVGDVRTFYLEKEHDILTGGFTGSNVGSSNIVTDLATILSNGEVVIDYGYVVTNKTTGNSTTYNKNALKSANILNYAAYDCFKTAGEYEVKFYVTMQDTVNKALNISGYPASTYTANSSSVTFTISKNTLYFFGNNLHTIYNGTNEFVAGTLETSGYDNDFGSFLYAKDWNGADLTASASDETKIGDVSEWFDGFMVDGSNFNVGSGKTLKMNLKKDLFGSRDLSGIFTNVTSESSSYTTLIEGKLNIDKARYTITFPNGSAYYIPNVQTIVYDNSANYTFTIGSVTFTYTYDKIVLPMGATAGVYKGQLNHTLDSANFIIQSLAITDHTDDRDSNFEWVISDTSVFNLLNSDDALKLDYSARYLTSNNGALADNLGTTYGGSADLMSIANVYVQGNSASVVGSQYSVMVDNNVILYVAGNGSDKLYAYINKDLLNTYTLTFDIVVNVSTARKVTLKPLTWASSTTTIAVMAEDFETFTAGYSTTVTPAYGNSNTTYYAVLTDAVKINLNYNTGKNASNNATEVVYASASSSVTVANPTHEYAGLAFNGYQLPSVTNLAMSSGSGNVTFTTTTGGKAENVSATWLFTDIVASLVKDTHNYKASRNALELALTDIASISLPVGTTSKTYALTSGSTTYAFSATTEKFTLKDANGFLNPNMSGTYTLAYSVTYSDGKTAPQTLNKTLNFTINITKNVINFTHDGSHLTYSNARQESKVALGYYLNSQKVSDIKLSDLSNIDNTLSEYAVFAVTNAEILNAGSYTITFTIDTALKDLYTFEVSSNQVQTMTINLVMDKFVIKLADYQAEIQGQLSKMFGLTEPNPIKATVTISENSNDKVVLYFSRANTSDAIGEYSATCQGVYESADQVNYTVDASGSSFVFKVVAPSGNLQVDIDSKFTYIYNGYALTNFTVTYDADQTKYVLSAKAGSETYSVTFNIYYEDGSNKIQIPADQKEAYGQMVVFASENAEAKVSTYTYGVTLTADAAQVWDGVDIVDVNKAKIEVTKRNLTVTSITKVFDQTTTLKYDSVSQAENTCEVTLQNLVDYGTSVDQIVLQGTFASSVVGEQTITALALTTEGASSNYNLVYADSLKVKVIADTSTTITAKINGSNHLEYGSLYKGLSVSGVNSLVPLMFNDGTVKAEYLAVTGYAVQNASYSTGDYLKVGTYVVRFTITSKNYTFGAERVDSLTNIYTTTQDLNVVVDQKAIIITNSSVKVTKIYDGNANVLDTFKNQTINESSYYVSSGLLDGDKIVIVSLDYNDRSIATGKNLINITLGEHDEGNYNITYTLVGDITSVNLVFNKNGASQTFVDEAEGNKPFGNSSAIGVTYSDNNIQTIISEIVKENNFMTRVGYTQVGYSYKGTDLTKLSSAEKETFLQDAVDSGSTGITIDAIWKINQYTLNFTIEHATIYIDENVTTSITVDYYTSFANIIVRADNGYTFEGYTLSNTSAVNNIEITTGLHYKNASFKIDNLLNDLTLTFNITEMEIRIVLNYNEPTGGYTASTATAGWVNVKEKVLTYSQLASGDLPVLLMVQEKTYDFDHWELNGEVNTGSTIWARINGDSLIQDNVDTGYTFVAHWTESELILTLDTDSHIDVVVKKGDTTLNAVENKITYHYNDTLSFTVTANNWYKWTVFNVDGLVTSHTGDTSATNKTTGAFVLGTIKEDLDVEIKSNLINVNFATSYTTPVGTTITETNGYYQGVYTYGSFTTLNSLFGGKYTPSVGTYNQDKWYYNGTTEVALDANLVTLITSLHGSIPVEDISFAFTANFVGLEYTVTFDKGTEAGAVFVEDNSAQQISRKFTYGSVMSGFPVATLEGKKYIWQDEAKDAYNDGQIFTTSLNNANLTLLLTANWDDIPYYITVNVVENEDQVTSIVYTGITYSEPVETVWDTNITFVFNLKTGYEINTDTTKTYVTLKDTSVETTITAQLGQITINKVQTDAVITVVIKPKDYTLKINKASYENISVTEYAVHYDMDMTEIFDLTTFVRNGYKISGLYSGTDKFATYSNDWIFDGTFTQNNLYKTDGDLTLTASWDYDASAGYVSVSTSVVSGLYYNGSLQKIASSTFIVASSETFAVGATFENGEKVNKVYYMLGDTELAGETDFSLYYKDYVAGNIYIVAVIEDIHTGNTHTISSTPQSFTLSKSEVNILNSNIVSYYSETNVVNPTAENNYGAPYYHDRVTANTELSIAKVEIIDSTNLYSVGVDYEVKYYFNSTAAFNINNYTGLAVEGGYVTLTTANMVSKVTADIVKTEVTLTFNEQGYYNGSVQRVQSFTSSFPNFASTFVAEISSITTATADIKKYQTVSEFDIVGVIKNSNNIDRTSNFKFVLDNETNYEIISTDNAFRVDFSGRYLNMATTDGSLEKLSSEIVSISSFSYSGNSHVVEDETISFMSDGKLILTITGNGSDSQFAWVTKGESVTFNFMLAEDALAVVAWTTWTDQSLTSDLITTLQTLTAEGLRSSSITLSSATTYYAVVTDYKAIKMSLGDKGGDQGYSYIKKGEKAIVANPAPWTGFEFSNWTTETANITISESEISVGANADITAGEIVAIWKLALPVARGTTFTFNAQLALDGTQKVTLRDILVSGIENKNTVINYAYSYTRDDAPITSSEGEFSVPANSTSTGIYKLTITASRAGYASQSSTVEFNIVVTRLTFTSMVINETIFTYANVDYIPDITVTFAGAVNEELDLKTLLYNEGSSYYFTLAGKDTTEIKLAGDYTLTLVVNDTIFDSDSFDEGFEFDRIFKVNKADLVLVQDDIPAEVANKLYLELDPEFVVTKTMFVDTNPEDVVVTLTREEGEDCRTYAFITIVSENENYNLSIEEGTVFTISPSDRTLIVELDEKLSMVYSKTEPDFVVNYNEEEGKWIVTLGSTSSTLTLGYKQDEETIYLSGILYRHALERIDFTAQSAINVGNYTGEDISARAEEGKQGNFAGYEFDGEFEITKFGLIISKVEKVFDRSDAIINSGVAYSNLIEGDSVVLNGKYKSLLVNDASDLVDLSLSGVSAGNYEIANPEFKGKITPATIGSIQFSLNNPKFVYGYISKETPVADLVTYGGGYTFSNGLVTDDIEKGYISIASFTVDEANLSNAGYLKVGNIQIKVQFSAINSAGYANFVGFAEEGYSITLNIVVKELDLSALTIIKQYDETTTLPTGISSSLTGYIMEGDQVEVDLTRSYYEDADIGQNKPVTIVLTGDDSANYSVKNNVTGTITSYMITLNVNATMQHADLVTDGAFVDPQESPEVVEKAFTLEFPSDRPASQALGSLTLPTRKGYTATGWKYYDSENDKYIAITAENIYAVLRSVALDQDNVDNEITIYTAWEINEYEIIIEGDNLENVELTALSGVLEGNAEDGYTVRYYTSISMKVKTARGYRLQAVNLAEGQVGSSSLGNVGTNEGTFTFNNIADDLRIEVITQVIAVTFDIDFNEPLYSTRTDKNSLSVKYNYTDLASLTESNLPEVTVTEGTYKFGGYTYGIDVKPVGSKTLQEIVDELFTTLAGDVKVTLDATWIGENYKIVFDANGGTLNGEGTISAVFGQAITSDFPTASLPGRSNTWAFGDTAYVKNDVLKSVGTKVGDEYQIVFTAVWTNNTYTLTVKFDNKLQVYANNALVTSGDVFNVVYNETQIAFTVSSSTGYLYDYDISKLEGNAEELGNAVVVKNLIADGEISFASVPDDNTLTIFTQNADDISAYLVTADGDNVLEVTEGKVVAKTESTVKIVINANKGWQFGEKSLVFAGNGSYSIELSDYNRTMTVIWSDFVDDATISITTEAGSNYVTTGDLNGIFASLNFNGEAVDLNGDAYAIKTGTDLVITGVLAYGYMDGVVSSGDVDFVVSQSNTFNTADRHYRFTATLAGFDDDFALTFTHTPRTFNFALSVREGDEFYGEVTSALTQTLKFGEELVLTQNEFLAEYMLEAWLYHSDKVLTTDKNVTIILSEAQKEMLECVSEGEIINIFAAYARKSVDITFASVGKGQFTISQAGEANSLLVESGTNPTQKIYAGGNLDFTIDAEEGYEVSQLLINGGEVSFADYGYDVATGEMSIFIELDTTITSITITFKASEATVFVQAGMRVNYVDYLGTNAGGNIYLTDSEGNRLDDALYLEGKGGNALIGGDYSVATYTDETLYFTVTPKSGFAFAVSADNGILINEYQTESGTTVFSFSNVKNGALISVLFTAKENVVNVKFALEGSTELVHAGYIVVDTSSNFVSSIPSMGDNLQISIITGADLILEVNSLLSYSLVADANGYIKYTILYNNEDEVFESSKILLGQVTPSESLKTGYTNSATFTIREVNMGATIIFYVAPREYSINFNVYDTTSVTMASKIHYGQEWTINLLTDSEKAIAFAKRSGYTFLGYYTLPNGQGTQYIDKDGNVLSKWFEDGYSFDGYKYELDKNFNDETSTFTLYANWLYNRADVTITFAPADVTSANENYNIAYVITNINSLSAWLDQNNKWYAEIVVGATLQVKALDFEGYTFVNWVVYFDNNEGINKPANFNLSKIEMGSYVLKAIYQPKFELTVKNQNNGLTNGGKASLIQDGITISGSYDSAKTVTLQATPNEGYKFLYFIDNTTGQILNGQVDTNGVGTYTYGGLISAPLSITAVFTGKAIKVNLDTKDIQTYHELVSVKVNGSAVDYTKTINASVGDTITVEITKSRGYGFEVVGANFTYVVDSKTKNYIFSYTFTLDGLTVIDTSTYEISIDFNAPREKIRFAFETELEEAVEDEIGKTGNLLLTAGNKETAVKYGSFYTYLFGDEFTLNINVGENYAIDKVYLFTTDMTYDVTDRVVSNKLVFDKLVMETYFDYEIKVKVYFDRLVWTEVRAEQFSGRGKKDSPYTISTVQEFALLSYLVNNGIVNEEEIPYADCYYAVTRNLDFAGRYFEPIGTEENPFNGTIDLGTYQFKNISHYRDYVNPKTSYSGLFWHITRKAEIIQSESSVVLVVIIIVVVIVLIGLIIFLILFFRKRNKKKLDDIASEGM